MRLGGVARAAYLAGLFVLLPACDGGGGSRYGDPDSSYEVADDSPAREEVAEEARQEVYSERGADSDGAGSDVSNVDAYSIENSGNYVCTDDCSGHEAGFEWAQENDVQDAGECDGYSMSFIEGCETFARERQEQVDRETQEAAELAAEEAWDDYEDHDEEEDYDDGRMIDGRY